MRIFYATSTLPYGSREPFLIPEIAELSNRGHEVTMVPMRPQSSDVVHDDVRPFVGAALALPLISPGIIAGALAAALLSPRGTLRAFRLLLRSRNPGVFAKNVAVFPKGLWLGRRVRELKADHLHAHWASTSSTMALIASEVSGVPWSLTAHRWDIRENNLLEVKAARACFIRAISERGARSLAAQLTSPPPGLRVLHMGVEIPELAPLGDRQVERSQLAVVCMADFVEVKGHRYLLDALRLLEDHGSPVRVDLVGDGLLREDVERRLAAAGLSDQVAVMGTVPHARLLDDLRAHRWDAAVLPSIVTRQAEEGIPVSLVEAMGAGIPVVATRTGSIPELLGAGAGLLVEGSDAAGLADALAELARNPDLRIHLAEEGRLRVKTSYDIELIVPVLVRWFEECAPA